MWHVLVYPNGENREYEGFVGVYLFIERDEIEVGCEFEMVRLVGNGGGVVRKWQELHKLRKTDPSYGFNRFMSRTSLLDENNGLIRNGDVELRVTISTYLEPQNTLTKTSEQNREIFDEEFKEESVRIPVKHVERMQGLAKSGKFSNVVLVSVDGQEFNAHRCILAAHSEVFEKMLDSPMKESELMRIQLDFPGNVVKELLNYLYSGTCLFENLEVDLFKISHMYGVSSLMAVCENIMIDNLTVENASKSLWFAKQYGIGLLYEAAADLLSFNVAEAKLSNDFQNFIEPDMELLKDLYDRVSSLNKGRSPDLKRKSAKQEYDLESVKRLCVYDVRQELEKRGLSPIGLRDDLVHQLVNSSNSPRSNASDNDNALPSLHIRGLDEDD
jgi:speckle-type POZ protein